MTYVTSEECLDISMCVEVSSVEDNFMKSSLLKEESAISTPTGRSVMPAVTDFVKLPLLKEPSSRITSPEISVVTPKTEVVDSLQSSLLADVTARIASPEIAVDSARSSLLSRITSPEICVAAPTTEVVDSVQSGLPKEATDKITPPEISVAHPVREVTHSVQSSFLNDTDSLGTSGVNPINVGVDSEKSLPLKVLTGSPSPELSVFIPVSVDVDSVKPSLPIDITDAESSSTIAASLMPVDANCVKFQLSNEVNDTTHATSRTLPAPTSEDVTSEKSSLQKDKSDSLIVYTETSGEPKTETVFELGSSSSGADTTSKSTADNSLTPSMPKTVPDTGNTTPSRPYISVIDLQRLLPATTTDAPTTTSPSKSSFPKTYTGSVIIPANAIISPELLPVVSLKRLEKETAFNPRIAGVHSLSTSVGVGTAKRKGVKALKSKKPSSGPAATPKSKRTKPSKSKVPVPGVGLTSRTKGVNSLRSPTPLQAGPTVLSSISSGANCTPTTAGGSFFGSPLHVGLTYLRPSLPVGRSGIGASPSGPVITVLRPPFPACPLSGAVTAPMFTNVNSSATSSSGGTFPPTAADINSMTPLLTKIVAITSENPSGQSAPPTSIPMEVFRSLIEEGNKMGVIPSFVAVIPKGLATAVVSPTQMQPAGNEAVSTPQNTYNSSESDAPSILSGVGLTPKNKAGSSKISTHSATSSGLSNKASNSKEINTDPAPLKKRRIAKEGENNAINTLKEMLVLRNRKLTRPKLLPDDFFTNREKKTKTMETPVTAKVSTLELQQRKKNCSNDGKDFANYASDSLDHSYFEETVVDYEVSEGTKTPCTSSGKASVPLAAGNWMSQVNNIPTVLVSDARKPLSLDGMTKTPNASSGKAFSFTPPPLSSSGKILKVNSTPTTSRSSLPLPAIIPLPLNRLSEVMASSSGTAVSSVPTPAFALGNLVKKTSPAVVTGSKVAASDPSRANSIPIPNNILNLNGPVASRPVSNSISIQPGSCPPLKPSVRSVTTQTRLPHPDSHQHRLKVRALTQKVRRKEATIESLRRQLRRLEKGLGMERPCSKVKIIVVNL